VLLGHGKKGLAWTISLGSESSTSARFITAGSIGARKGFLGFVVNLIFLVRILGAWVKYDCVSKLKTKIKVLGSTTTVLDLASS